MTNSPNLGYMEQLQGLAVAPLYAFINEVTPISYRFKPDAALNLWHNPPTLTLDKVSTAARPEQGVVESILFSQKFVKIAQDSHIPAVVNSTDGKAKITASRFVIEFDKQQETLIDAAAAYCVSVGYDPDAVKAVKNMTKSNVAEVNKLISQATGINK